MTTDASRPPRRRPVGEGARRTARTAVTEVTTHLTVADLDITVVRKAIKNLHLGVYPPSGRVRVAVPWAVSDDAVRLAVIGKLGWIRRQQAKFEGQARQSERELVSGESHYFEGTRYLLEVVEGPPGVRLLGPTRLELRVRPGATREQREAVLVKWYREHLRERVPALLAEWQPKVGAAASDWGIKHMKTRWGTCNPTARRIWINLELAKKPPACLEYVVVHELVHLLEPNHGAGFQRRMDALLPTWRVVRAELNRLPLGHEAWGE